MSYLVVELIQKDKLEIAEADLRSGRLSPGRASYHYFY